MRNNQKLWPKAIMLSVVLLCFTMTAVAQMIKVSGVVLDTHQEPVIGATVKVIGTGNGTVTDIDGKFSLEANRSARVSISYVGYKTLEQRVQLNMHVVMEEEANILSEVVAIGYGSVKRKDVTTAVSSVNTEDLETRPIVSAVQGMQGKAAGLQISQANGQPGSAPTIRVRGTTSLNGSNNPLYVVDGVPVDNIDYLSANDIDNIQILKDASSAAIYGSRAANGVVIIGTKRNKLTRLELVPVYWGAVTNDNVGQSVVRNAVGHPLGAFWGYVADGVDRETGDMIYRDVNEDGVVSASDRTYIGDPNPDFTYGLTNTFSWKGLNLSILVQGSVGNDIYNVSRMESEGMFNGRNQSKGVLDRWRVPGQNKSVPRVGFNQQNSTYYLEDGSYLRVKDISLSYDVPKNAIDKLHLTRLMPYISFSNLLTWTNYSGRDPEVNQYGNSGGVQGIDWGTYPLNRSFVMGLKVEF